MSIHVAYEARERVTDATFAIAIFDPTDRNAFSTNTDIAGVDPGELSGKGIVTFRFDRLPLLDGTYQVHAGVHSRDATVSYDHHTDCSFVVSSGTGAQGVVDLAPTIDIVPEVPGREAAG